MVFLVESWPRGKKAEASKMAVVAADRGDLDAKLLLDTRFEGRTIGRKEKKSPGWLHIEGRRWFRKTYGNTYHSARVYVDGQLLADTGKHYGYDEQYLWTAVETLKSTGFLPVDAKGGTFYLREMLDGIYTVNDVARERDL